MTKRSHLLVYILTRNPNDPLFLLERPCFGGLTPKRIEDKQAPGIDALWLFHIPKRDVSSPRNTYIGLSLTSLKA